MTRGGQQRHNNKNCIKLIKQEAFCVVTNKGVVSPRALCISMPSVVYIAPLCQFTKISQSADVFPSVEGIPDCDF